MHQNELWGCLSLFVKMPFSLICISICSFDDDHIIHVLWKKNAISYLGSQLSFFDKRSTRVFKFDTARGFMAKSHFSPSVARTHHLLWRSLLKRTAVPHRYRMHNSLCVHVCMLKSMILINWRLSLFPQTDTAWHCDFTAKPQNYITLHKYQIQLCFSLSSPRTLCDRSPALSFSETLF